MCINIEQNNIKNIFPYKIALFDSNTELTFSYVEEFSGGAFCSVTGVDDPRASHERVKAQKLDDFIKSNKIERIDLIKIDVEGAEINVIQGG